MRVEKKNKWEKKKIRRLSGHRAAPSQDF